MRRILRRGVLAMGGVLLALVVAEIAVRWIDPGGVAYFRNFRRYQVEALQRSDLPGVLYEHRPGTSLRAGVELRFDAHGLRGAGIPSVAGRRRVLVLGDSVAFGWGVAEDEAFPARLQHALRGAGRDADVLNAGVVGYNTVQQAGWLEGRGLGLQPDLVVLLCTDNDVGMAIDVVRHLQQGPPERPAELNAWIGPWDWWVIVHPHRLTLLDLLRDRRLRALLAPPDNRADLPRHLERMAALRAFLASGSPKVDPGACLQALERIATACRTRGVPCVVAPFTAPAGFPAACAALGVPFLAGVDHGLTGEAHRISAADGHPDAAAHRMLAERVAAVLVERNLP